MATTILTKEIWRCKKKDKCFKNLGPGTIEIYCNFPGQNVHVQTTLDKGKLVQRGILEKLCITEKNTMFWTAKRRKLSIFRTPLCDINYSYEIYELVSKIQRYATRATFAFRFGKESRRKGRKQLKGADSSFFKKNGSETNFVAQRKDYSSTAYRGTRAKEKDSFLSAALPSRIRSEPTFHRDARKSALSAGYEETDSFEADNDISPGQGKAERTNYASETLRDEALSQQMLDRYSNAKQFTREEDIFNISKKCVRDILDRTEVGIRQAKHLYEEKRQRKAIPETLSVPEEVSKITRETVFDMVEKVILGQLEQVNNTDSQNVENAQGTSNRYRTPEDFINVSRRCTADIVDKAALITLKGYEAPIQQMTITSAPESMIPRGDDTFSTARSCVKDIVEQTSISVSKQNNVGVQDSVSLRKVKHSFPETDDIMNASSRCLSDIVINASMIANRNQQEGKYLSPPNGNKNLPKTRNLQSLESIISTYESNKNFANELMKTEWECGPQFRYGQRMGGLFNENDTDNTRIAIGELNENRGVSYYQRPKHQHADFTHSSEETIPKCILTDSSSTKSDIINAHITGNCDICSMLLKRINFPELFDASDISTYSMDETPLEKCINLQEISFEKEKSNLSSVFHVLSSDVHGSGADSDEGGSFFSCSGSESDQEENHKTLLKRASHHLIVKPTKKVISILKRVSLYI